MALALCLSISCLGSSFVALQGSVSPTRPRTQTDIVVQESGCAPAWLPTFGASRGADDGVFALASVQLGAERELFAGGWFRHIDDLAANRIARLTSTGWQTLGNGLPGTVLESSRAMLEHDDGHGRALFVGGQFARAGDVPARYMARWDGSAWSAVGASLGGPVLALAEYEMGGVRRLIAGGIFLEFDGCSANGLAMWDGSTWSDLGTGTDGYVYSLASFDDGSGPALYASGLFTSAGGVPASNIARWDGSQWSAVGLGLDSPAFSMVVHDDGRGPRLFVGGEFTQAGGQPARHLACWDGSNWSELGGGTNEQVRCMLVHPEPQGEVLIVGGCFTEAGGVEAKSLARWDGSSWSPLGAGLEDNCVMTLTTHIENSQVVLYAGGWFMTSGAQDIQNIARWDGTDWSPLRSGIAHPPADAAVVDTGTGPRLHFSDWHGWLKRLEPSGWEVVERYWSGSLALEELDLGSGAELFAKERISGSGQPVDSVLRREGDAWVPLPDSPQGSVVDLVAFDEGAGPRLFACGGFNEAGGAAAAGIARWDGASWSPLGLGLDPPSAESMVVLEENGNEALFVAGQFTFAGGHRAKHVARWDGVEWSPLAGGLEDGARLVSFASLDGPELYAFGRFRLPGNATYHQLARWDGFSWQAIPTPLASIESCVVHDDGRGPALFMTGGISAPWYLLGIQRWNGFTWSTLGSGLVGGSSTKLLSANLGSGPALLAWGDFLARDSGDENLALWGCVDTAPPRLDLSPQFVADGWTDGPGEVVELHVVVRDEDPSPRIEFAPPSGSFFPRGTTLVTCTATDASGNVATGQFELTVQPKLRRP